MIQFNIFSIIWSNDAHITLLTLIIYCKQKNMQPFLP